MTKKIQSTTEPEEVPMPAPYTTVPNGMPVGVWMPGRYHNPEHMEWRDKQDGKTSKPKDASIDLTDAHTWNGGTFGQTAGIRTCVLPTCGRSFVPTNGNQKACCPAHSSEWRKQQQREFDKARVRDQTTKGRAA